MNYTEPFSLILFSTEPEFIQKATTSGIDTIIVDWENRGKGARQSGVNTQINYNTLDDLKRARAATKAGVICRINAFDQKTTPREVEQAIEAGTDEILLPMVRTMAEIESVLRWTNERCKVGILIETVSAVNIAKQLGQLPLARIYVGLNDLGIERHTPNIFVALLDRTIDQIRSYFNNPFGFGGLTLPDQGYPIPCRLLIAELARLKCNFSFLRRSFHRDIQGRSMETEIPKILEAIAKAKERTEPQIAQDKYDLDQVIMRWPALKPEAG